MRRKGAGIGAVSKDRLQKAKFEKKGTEIADAQVSQLTTHLEQFKTHLERFASKHKNEIRKDPEFRNRFQQMCARSGVDPLASSKGFWAEMLGVGDFYYELGVQIVEVCMATRDRNGGLISLEELWQRLKRSRRTKHSQEVSMEDVSRAIKKLHVLGGGFAIIPVGGRKLVQSVPGELNMDHTRVLQLAEDTGHTYLSQVTSQLKWEEARAASILDHLVREGMAWVDDQAGDERHYWFPSLLPDLAMASLQSLR
ncbi:vacuolar-sorting protein SNF8-like [Sycon ciliatum]|uniref:vacuolar-sorting protein SNF8-like n=1 Tax=Sycon ciliatum TaxID=27933 RepID=UPI0020A88DB7|eukprot:scpid78902/ scgid15680/ Vacuolar-sorting protein SNF8; ELL-associated protein of 30 kDa; ESCRT-II complex subunit VPS22